MVRLGLVLFVVGGVLDIVFHTLSHRKDFLPNTLGSDGQLAHLVTFIGMVVMVLGILWEYFLVRRAAFQRPDAQTLPHQNQDQNQC